MANGFAGAGQSADRRRRRLSHDLADQDDFQVHLAAEAPNGQAGTQVWSSEFDTQLLRKVLSPHLWKHATVITILAIFTAAAIYLLTTGTSPRLQHTTSRFAACFLLFSGQLALLIGWIRGESDLDYKGRFRWWTSLAITLLSTAILRLTDSTTWAADTAVALVELGTGSLNAARPAVLLLPFVVASALLAYRIIPDMQRCFESQFVMVISAITLITMIVWQHIGSTDSSQIIIASLDLTMTVLTFSSLLLHARYVAYVNHDPPELIQNSMTEAGHKKTASEKRADENTPVVFNEPKQITKDESKIAAETTEQPEMTEQPEVEAKKTAKQRKRRKTRRAA